MSDIYELHSKAFSHVAAYAVLKDGKMVAKVAFKYPKDGAGRLYAYVHWIGCEMQRGFASGCGYDKHSAAVATATAKINLGSLSPAGSRDAETFYNTARRDGGSYWNNSLEAAGFTVHQVV